VQNVAPGIFVLDASNTGAILNAVTFAQGPFSPTTAANGTCDKRTRLAIYGTGIRLAAAGTVQAVVSDSTGKSWQLGVEYAGAASLPELPPAIRTLPSESRVAVCPDRGFAMVPVAV